jgi:23S rRNA (cytidine2498-2'-O)-methyltransferase
VGDNGAVTTAYLAAEGYEKALADELDRFGAKTITVHERLHVCEGGPVDAAWAVNTWFDVEEVEISSIGDAAAKLRARQRNWAAYAPVHRGRAGLITAKLPPLSNRVLEPGQAAPASPLGSWTLLEADRMLVSERCSSSFPNGEVPLAEIKQGPPNRAYRKLWEAFVVLGRYPEPGDLAVDLGASPGGWTWLLAQLGCHVVAVDKAPLDPAVAAMPGVREVQGSAFGLRPGEVSGRAPQWVCSDIACYPDRLFRLIDTWRDFETPPTLVFTVKFQGPTDHEVAARLRALPGARLVHLHHNKHELTLMVS